MLLLEHPVFHRTFVRPNLLLTRVRCQVYYWTEVREEWARRKEINEELRISLENVAKTPLGKLAPRVSSAVSDVDSFGSFVILKGLQLKDYILGAKKFPSITRYRPEYLSSPADTAAKTVSGPKFANVSQKDVRNTSVFEIALRPLSRWERFRIRTRCSGLTNFLTEIEDYFLTLPLVSILIDSPGAQARHLHSYYKDVHDIDINISKIISEIKNVVIPALMSELSKGNESYLSEVCSERAHNTLKALEREVYSPVLIDALDALTPLNQRAVLHHVLSVPDILWHGCTINTSEPTFDFIVNTHEAFFAYHLTTKSILPGHSKAPRDVFYKLCISLCPNTGSYKVQDVQIMSNEFLVI